MSVQLICRPPLLNGRNPILFLRVLLLTSRQAPEAMLDVK